MKLQDISNTDIPFEVQYRDLTLAGQILYLSGNFVVVRLVSPHPHEQFVERAHMVTIPTQVIDEDGAITTEALAYLRELLIYSYEDEKIAPINTDGPRILPPWLDWKTQ